MTAEIDRTPPTFDHALPLVFIQESGLLWAINHFCLHPVGLALAMAEPSEPHPNGLPSVVLHIEPSDDGVWKFSPDIDVERSEDWAAFLTLVRGGAIPPKLKDLTGGDV